MQIEMDCINCLAQVALRVHKMISPEDWTKISPRILRYLAELIDKEELPIPTHVSSLVLRSLQREKPGFDPFEKIKKESNQLGEELASSFIANSKDELSIKQLLLYAAAGNIIDYALIDSLEACKKIILEIESKGFVIDDTEELIKNLEVKRNLLYFPDNSGEIIFDKLLLQYIKAHYDIHIKVCIHTGYMLNDATKDEIISLGFLDFVDEIIDIKPEFLGFDLDHEHRYLKKYFTKDSFIISKGLANYECFDAYTMDVPVVYIMLAKCRPIANRLGININDPVLKIK